MALRDHRFLGWLPVKPTPINGKGTAAALAAGDRVFKRDGVNPELVKAVKAAIRNSRQRQAKIKAVAVD